MRHTIITTAMGLGLGVAAASTHAQASALGTRVSDYGGFVGLDARFGDMASEFAAFSGAEVALLLKHRVYIGIRGGGLSTDNARVPATGTSDGGTLAMGYGGFILGYVIPTTSPVDFSVDVLLGGGGVGTTNSDSNRDWDAIFVFEPSATVDLKLAPAVRIGLGAAYRYVGDAEVVGFRDSNFRGVTGLVRARVGRF